MAALYTQVLSMLLLSSFFPYVSAQSRSYIIHMDPSAMPRAFSTHHSWYESTLSSISEDSQAPIASKLIHTYTNAIHGFSAILTPSELETLKKSPAFVHSTPDYPVQLHTTYTSKFLGLCSTSGVWPSSSFGEDVIIGIVDSGIWPESKSFSDVGMTKVPSRWKGKCESGEQFNSSLCNKKLIGARFFNKGLRANKPETKVVIDSPRDDDGHGTHCASIAAGEKVQGVSYFGYANGSSRGTAPNARVAAYKVMWSQDGYSSDIIAGIDQAIQDGVDILSISLGIPLRKEQYLEEDPIVLATFAAMERGIFVAKSAGNRGRLHGTIDGGAPWLTVVGAGTVDRELEGVLALGNGIKIPFESLYPSNDSSLVQVPIVFANKCKNVKKLKKRLKDKIIVCKDQRTTSLETQVENVKSARVTGAVFITEDNWKEFYSYEFAAAFIDSEEGKKVTDYINKNKKSAIATLDKTVIGTNAAPKLARYSSRGPYIQAPSVLKPDIIAPGSSILASWTLAHSVAEVQSGSLFSNFNIISGTSMATPHVAGVAALIKKVHPDWSPAAIRSALMTTANPLDHTHKPIKDIGNSDHPASPLEIGAGHIDPNKVLGPGLVYDATPEDYIKLLCAMNYTTKQIQAITRSNHNCVNPSLDLNYPSFIAYFIDYQASNPNETVVREFRRTVTNVGHGMSIYRANLTAMAGLKLKVEPKELVFKRKYEKLRYKLTVEGPKYLEEEVIQGSLSWVESRGKHVVRSPIVATNIDPMTT